MKKNNRLRISHAEIVKLFEENAYMSEQGAKVSRYPEQGRSREIFTRHAAIYREAIRRLEEHAARTKKTNELLVKLTKKRAARRRGRTK